MTKRIKKRYKLLRFYQEDLWGLLLSNINFFKKVKINYLLSEMLTEIGKIGERKRIVNNNMKGKQWMKRKKKDFLQQLLRKRKAEFNYRIDIGKPSRRIRRLSLFGLRLKHRHKLRKFCSSMNVRQFRNYIKKAHKNKALFLTFIRFLETRLDTILYRVYFFRTAEEGRQLINHGNFLINGNLSVFSNQKIQLFDIVSVKKKEVFFFKLKELIKINKIFMSIPIYIEVNYRIMSAIIFINPMLFQIYYPSLTDANMSVVAGKRFKN